MSTFDIEKTRQELVRITQAQGIGAAIQQLEILVNDPEHVEFEQNMSALSEDVIKEGLKSRAGNFIAEATTAYDFYMENVRKPSNAIFETALCVVDTAIDMDTDAALLDAYSILNSMLEDKAGVDLIRTQATSLFNAASRHVTANGVRTCGLCHEILTHTNATNVVLDSTLERYIDNVAKLNEPEINAEAMDILVHKVSPQEDLTVQQWHAMSVAPYMLQVMNAAAQSHDHHSNQAVLACGITLIQDYNLDTDTRYAAQLNKFEMMLPDQTLVDIRTRRQEYNNKKFENDGWQFFKMN